MRQVDAAFPQFTLSFDATQDVELAAADRPDHAVACRARAAEHAALFGALLDSPSRQQRQPVTVRHRRSACVEPVGHDFRPEYRALTLLHERWPAGAAHCADGHGRCPHARVTSSSGSCRTHARSSAALTGPTSAIHRRKKRRHHAAAALHRARASGEAGVVYCQSRKRVDEPWPPRCAMQASTPLPYHAGLDTGCARTTGTAFSEEGIVMVATIASVCTDKPDVRFCGALRPRTLKILTGNRPRGS